MPWVDLTMNFRQMKKKTRKMMTTTVVRHQKKKMEEERVKTTRTRTQNLAKI